MNDSPTVIAGNLVLHRQSPSKIASVAVSIPAGGARVVAVDSLGEGVWSAQWERIEGEPAAITGTVRYSSAGLTRQLALVSRPPSESILLPIVRKPGRATSPAIHNPSGTASDTLVTLRTTSGVLVGEERIVLGDRQTVAAFLGDIFEDLPVHFEGLLEVTGPIPFLFEAFISVETTRGLLLTAWSDLGSDRDEGALVLPLVAVGESLRTDLQLVNLAPATARFRLRLRKEKDEGMRVFLNY